MYIRGILGFFKAIWFIIKSLVLTIIPIKLLFKPRSLDREVALVTGAGSGLGRSLSIKLAKNGVRRLIIWDIDEQGLKDTFYAIEQSGAKCWPYVVDVTNREQVYETATKMNSEIGLSVTMLVNNAGVVCGGQILDIPDDQVEKMFAVNAVSHFWVIPIIDIEKFPNDYYLRPSKHSYHK